MNNFIVTFLKSNNDLSGNCINGIFLIDNKQTQNIFYCEELDELNILQLDAHAYVHGRRDNVSLNIFSS